MIYKAIALLIGASLLQASSGLLHPMVYGICIVLMITVLLFTSISVIKLLAIGIAGYAWCGIVADSNLKNWLPNDIAGKSIWVSGEILSVNHQTEKDVVKIRLDINETQYLNNQQILYWQPRCKLSLSWYIDAKSPLPSKLSQMIPGSQWKIAVRLRRPRGLVNPYGFDSAHYSLVNNICAFGYVRDRLPPQLLAQVDESKMLFRLRNNISMLINNNIGSNNFAAMAKALIIGERGDISESDWQLYRDTGVTHLLAISGLHISLITAVLYGLVTSLCKCLPQGIFTHYTRFSAISGGHHTFWAALISLIGAFCYAALAGFSLPTQRALLMLVGYLVADLIQRKVRLSDRLALALITVIVVQPLWVNSVSFVLSFAAAASLAIASIFFNAGKNLDKQLKIYEPYDRKGIIDGERGSKLAQKYENLLHRCVDGLRNGIVVVGKFIKLQLFIICMLIPVTAYFFNIIAWSSPLANLVVVPLVGIVILPGLFIALFTVTFWQWGGNFIFYLCEQLSHGLHAYLLGLTQIFEASSMPMHPKVVYVMALVGIVVLFIPATRWKKMLGVLCCLPLLLGSPPLLPKKEFKLTMLDVGQGQAIVVQTSQHALLIDAGPARTDGSTRVKGFDAGKSIVYPYLRAQGVDTLDTMVLTHAHSDHSGGASFLLRNFAINEVHIPPVQKSVRMLDEIKSNISPPSAFPSIHQCHHGKEWVWDEVRFTYLYPLSGITSNSANINNESCVLRVDNGQISVLIPADIERQAEQNLVKMHGSLLRSMVLVAPHHGSNTSSTTGFLQHVQPKWVMISAGFNNRFKFPHRQTLERYAQYPVTVYNTAYEGAIDLYADRKGELTWLRQRAKFPYFWRE